MSARAASLGVLCAAFGVLLWTTQRRDPQIVASPRSTTEPRRAPDTAAPRVTDGVDVKVSAAPPLTTTAAADADVLPAWGYASERNKARWSLIRPILGEVATVLSQTPTACTALDFGADQGFFSIATALALRPQNCTVLAIERGGVGGTIFGGKKKKGMDVHAIIRDRAAKAFPSGRVAVDVCSTIVTSKTFERLRSHRPCAPAVVLVLSMLHWVNGVETHLDFAAAVCQVATTARVTVFELPNPLAKGTMGDKRYGRWYKDSGSNVTRALELALSRCQNGAKLRMSLVGSTPWGKTLTREIHRVDNDGWLSFDVDGTEACRASLGCPSVTAQPPPAWNGGP